MAGNFRDHAAEKARIADVAEVEIADESGGASAPRVRKIGKADADASGASERGVDDGGEPGEQRGGEEIFDEAMEVKREAHGKRDEEDEPRGNAREEEEAEQTDPDGGDFVERADECVGVFEGEDGCGDEADGENGEHERGPERGGSVARWGGEHPRLVEEEVSGEEDGLDDADETQQALVETHGYWIRAEGDWIAVKIWARCAQRARGGGKASLRRSQCLQGLCR